MLQATCVCTLCVQLHSPNLYVVAQYRAVPGVTEVQVALLQHSAEVGATLTACDLLLPAAALETGRVLKQQLM
jgi:hypothetical protein